MNSNRKPDPSEFPVTGSEPPQWFMRLTTVQQGFIALCFALYFTLWTAFCPVATRFPHAWSAGITLAIGLWFVALMWFAVAALEKRGVQLPDFFRK